MKEIRLPQSKKEGLLYGLIICTVTVFVMLLLNVGGSFGKINSEVMIIILKMLPIIVVVAMLLETLLVGKIAEKLVKHFSNPSDNFNAKILFNILFCVTGMSCIMTIVGAMIGQGRISFDPFTTFFSHWPRNFCVALWCELLLAQPLARLAMKKMHTKKLAR